MLPEQPARELFDAVELADTQRTERIRLGPCVAPIYMRDSTYVAQLAATLDELSDGRAEVVFGIGNIAMLEQYGVEWRGTRPIARLREAHQVMRTFLDQGSIDFEGDFYSYSGVTSAARPVRRWPAYGLCLLTRGAPLRREALSGRGGARGSKLQWSRSWRLPARSDRT